MKKTEAKSDIEKLLEATPDKRGAIKWTKTQDDLLLKYVPTKGIEAVSVALGFSHSATKRRFLSLGGSLD